MSRRIHITATKTGVHDLTNEVAAKERVPVALSGLNLNLPAYPGFRLWLHPGLYSCRRFTAQKVSDLAGREWSTRYTRSHIRKSPSYAVNESRFTANYM